MSTSSNDLPQWAREAAKAPRLPLTSVLGSGFAIATALLLCVVVVRPLSAGAPTSTTVIVTALALLTIAAAMVFLGVLGLMRRHAAIRINALVVMALDAYLFLVAGVRFDRLSPTTLALLVLTVTTSVLLFMAWRQARPAKK